MYADEVVNVDISSKRMLDKMEELVTKAKLANSETKLQGYVVAIQALCEVMVDEKSENNKIMKPVTFTQPVMSNIPNAEPVKMDEANGDSLFDF
ncbi:YwdI family protein [Peribacillus sp.]|uniref:YwdI family protein n=1 Tax=Peribacillus sp. TaxID=2675267 RepID=UPI003890F74E